MVKRGRRIMKYLIRFFILILFLFSNLAYASGVRNIQENYQVIYNILDNTGTFVSGETVPLKIKKVSNGYWFDFDDSTFKTSGWTSKSTNLSEDATEDYYYYTFDPPASETTADQYLFVVSNTNATYKDHQGELISYQDIGNSDFDYSSNNVTVGDFVSGVIDDDALGTITELPKSTDYSIARAGYLDKLNVSGTLAHSDSASTYKADVSALATSAALAIAQTDLDTPDQYKATGFLTDKAGFSLSASGIDAIWNELQAGHTTVGTFGKYLDSEISAISATISEADKDDIVDKTWDELLSGHTTVGTAGTALSTASSAGDPWETELPGSYTGTQAGKIVGDNIDATVSSRAKPSDVIIYTGQ